MSSDKPSNTALLRSAKMTRGCGQGEPKTASGENENSQQTVSSDSTSGEQGRFHFRVIRPREMAAIHLPSANATVRMHPRQLNLLLRQGRRRPIARHIPPASADHPWHGSGP